MENAVINSRKNGVDKTGEASSETASMPKEGSKEMKGVGNTVLGSLKHEVNKTRDASSGTASMPKEGSKEVKVDTPTRCLLCIAAKLGKKIREGEKLTISTDTMTKTTEKTIKLWYRERKDSTKRNKKFILTGLRGGGKSAYLKMLHKKMDDKKSELYRDNNVIWFIDFEKADLDWWIRQLCNVDKENRTEKDLETKVKELLEVYNTKDLLGYEGIDDLAKKKNLFLWIDNWELLLSELIVAKHGKGAYTPQGVRLLTRAVVNVFRDINETCREYTRGGVCISISNELRKSIYEPKEIEEEYYNTKDFWQNEDNIRNFLKEYIEAGVNWISGEYTCDPCINPDTLFRWESSETRDIIDRMMALQGKLPNLHPTKMIYALSHACGSVAKPGCKGEEHWDENIKQYYTEDRKPKYLEEQLSLIYICCGNVTCDESSSTKSYSEEQEKCITTAIDALMDTRSGESCIHDEQETEREWIKRLSGFGNEKLQKAVFKYLVDADILVKVEGKDEYEINAFLKYLYGSDTLKKYMEE